MAQAIGIDIGGTFIDLVVSDEAGLRIFKFPSTPDAPERGVLAALSDLAECEQIDPRCVRRVVHGSTVATNALLEETWARTALVTTEGFRDVLEIGRQNRSRLYDLYIERPDPIVPRDLRYECTERLDATGNALRTPSKAELEGLADRIGAARVDAIAVVFLFSYLNDAHEQAVGQILSERLNIPVTLSSQVLPEFREYERTSTTAVCAALRPIIERYIQTLAAGSSEAGFVPEWQIMQSNGTVISAKQAQQEPVRILLSGPAAGVQGAKIIGSYARVSNLISLDMGGTSCDVALIRNGEIGQTTTGAVGPHPVAVRMNEIHTIGAGGGSIAWIDEGGALRVGPKSSGAIPGPACYGRGGTNATVSDAHAVLGHLPSRAGLGGLHALDIGRAREAVGSIADRLSMSVEEAALGILDVADAAMERAVRVISVERGFDPREFALLAFGGAGPLHAASIARRLSIPQILVPAAAGVLSAVGLLACEIGRDYGRSVLRSMSDVSSQWVAEQLQEMEAQGLSDLQAEGVDEKSLRRAVSADMRYRGQSHELNIPWDGVPNEGISEGDLLDWIESFHQEHASRFGHASRGEEIEWVTLRVRLTAPPTFATPRMNEQPAENSSTESVWFDAGGPTDTQVIDRRSLAPGKRLAGPAIVWGPDATLLVPPGMAGQCDAIGTLILERQ